MYFYFYNNTEYQQGSRGTYKKLDISHWTSIVGLHSEPFCCYCCCTARILIPGAAVQRTLKITCRRAGLYEYEYVPGASMYGTIRRSLRDYRTPVSSVQHIVAHTVHHPAPLLSAAGYGCYRHIAGRPGGVSGYLCCRLRLLPAYCRSPRWRIKLSSTLV